MSITDVQIAKSDWLLNSWVATTQVSKIKEKLIGRGCIYTMTMQTSEKEFWWVKRRDTLVWETTCQPALAYKQQSCAQAHNCLRGVFSLRRESVKTHLGSVNLLVLLSAALRVHRLMHCAARAVLTCCKVLLCTPAIQCSQSSESYLCLLLFIQKSKCKYI